MPKKQTELHDVSVYEWRPVEGYPEGAFERILSYDEETGSVTRLLRCDPGYETHESFSHDFWEEVYILKGGQIDKRLNQVFSEGMYCCRRPGMIHGPYKVPTGMMTLEFRYYMK